ncbi:MAG: hypothetical protein ABI882_09455 [Acidobacteriota bacterium]
MTSKASPDPRTSDSSESESADAMPECCDSGCTVCVLDYPELFLKAGEDLVMSAPETSALLEALAKAESLIELLHAEKHITQPEIEGGE